MKSHRCPCAVTMAPSTRRTEEQTRRKLAGRGRQTDPLGETPEQEGEGEQDPEL